MGPLIPHSAPSGALRFARAIARVVSSFVSEVQIPGLVPIAAAAMVLVAAANLASVTPAARASRVDVVRALRSE